jgi:hypothetical protein
MMHGGCGDGKIGKAVRLSSSSRAPKRKTSHLRLRSRIPRGVDKGAQGKELIVVAGMVAEKPWRR